MTGPDRTPDKVEAAADEALRLFPQPVAVVGVARHGELGGLTAAWVTRVSMVPPLVVVSIGHARRTFDLLEGAAEFTVSLLAEGQVTEARLFGLHSRRDRDKWAETPHVLLGAGVPALARCAARLLCAVESRFTTGDHDCVVGRVTAAEVVAGGPALPLRGGDYAPDAG
ncbi:MAG: flavin reductase family protein [Krumholzibacteria bacterium]|nr:flavin reductase family protein [Candidatus Krumholzibacteria bacterium]